jgi:PAS domain S-box-containing protein
MTPHYSLRVKLNLSLAGLALFIAGTLMILLYSNLKKRLREDVSKQLENVCAVAALQIDSEAHHKIKQPGDEKKQEYLKILDTLRKIKQNLGEDVRYIYTMRENKNGKSAFVVDEDPNDPAGIGEELEDPNNNFKLIEKKGADKEFTTDRWGTWLSGYAPFFQKDGTLEGVIGMDISAKKVLHSENQFLLLGLAIFLLLVPLSLLLGWLLSGLLITPITKAEKAVLEAESRYRDIFNQAPVGIFQSTVDGKLLNINPEMARIFKYDNAEEMLAIKDVKQTLYLHPNTREEFIEQLNTQGQVKIFEFDGKRKDGSCLWGAINAWAVKDSKGNIVLINGFIADISEQKKLRDNLIESKLKAEKASKIKSEFLANMSHEIRTPMNGVIGVVSLLERTELNLEQKDYLEIIKISGNALLQLINDILDFSKIEAGKFELEMADFRIDLCLEKTLDLIAHEAAQKKLDLIYHIEDKVPTMVTGDEARLRQVILNLLSNAVKFTETGQIMVAVKTTDKKDFLEVSVEDSGIGIPQEKHDELFQMFSQVDSSASRKYGGSGLGLAICRKLVEMMEGKITLESSVGKGTKFTFCVKLEGADMPDEPTPVDLSGKKILIVEDNPVLLDDMSKTLSKHGAQTFEAESLTAASSQSDKEKFDLILLDASLEKENILEVQLQLEESKENGSPPIILITQIGDMAQTGSLFDSKIAAHINKPVKKFKLLKLVQQVINKELPDNQSITNIHDNSYKLKRELNILIAEDHLLNQKLIMGILKKLNLKPDLSVNGLEVLNALEKKHYDLILMDCQMPEMDGYQATREIVKKYPPEARPKIIAMTANVLEQDRQKCFECGMDGFIGKPVVAKDIENLLESLTQDNQENSGKFEKPLEKDKEETFPDLLDENILSSHNNIHEGFLKELIKIFEEETPENIKDITESYNSGDIEKLELKAHALKGNSASLGAPQLSFICREIQFQARDRELEGIEKWIGLLDECYSTTLKELDKYISKNSA